MAKTEILLTIQQVEDWQKEADELAAKIAEDQRRLAEKIAEDQRRLDELRSKLKAAAPFMPRKQIRMPMLPGAREKQEAKANEVSDNMTEAIERLAHKQGPISRKELKRLLAEEGFPADRLANYFYTAIHRLKAKERISENDDGSLGPAL
jgi:hypothetical protein